MDLLVRPVSKVTSLCPVGRSTLLTHSLTFALLCSRPQHWALQSVRYHQRFTYLVVMCDGIFVDVDPACRRRRRREDLGSGQSVIAQFVTLSDHRCWVMVCDEVEAVDSGRPWAGRQQLTVVTVHCMITSRPVVAVNWQPASCYSHIDTIYSLCDLQP